MSCSSIIINTCIAGLLAPCSLYIDTTVINLYIRCTCTVYQSCHTNGASVSICDSPMFC